MLCTDFKGTFCFSLRDKVLPLLCGNAWKYSWELHGFEIGRIMFIVTSGGKLYDNYKFTVKFDNNGRFDTLSK